MLHFRRMLRQAIKQSGIPDGRQWMETLSHLIVKASSSIHVHSHATEDQDVRNYVKIKKVQGGKISDSEYIAGVVITKGFTHKEMPRHHVNPRIMLVKFPLEYSRVPGQFIVLEAAIAQEADYLAKLVLRIVAVRPHIVLFEQGVSHLALEGLHKAKIAVARSVPQKGLDALRRCTQADVIGSIDKLSQHPRMGRCAHVRVQTFDHELIPGRRKTLMRFEGCPPELGCTLLLRGGDRETLRKVKEITDFMVFVAYHLRLEKMLWYDEFNILPRKLRRSRSHLCYLPETQADRLISYVLVQPRLLRSPFLKCPCSAAWIQTRPPHRAPLRRRPALPRPIQPRARPVGDELTRSGYYRDASTTPSCHTTRRSCPCRQASGSLRRSRSPR
jgi:1-phosphatidylinositol-3-phosphate 5-kinase